MQGDGTMNISAMASAPSANTTLPPPSVVAGIDENDVGHSKKRNIGKTAEAEELVNGKRGTSDQMKLQQAAEKELANLHKDKYIMMPDSPFRVRWDLCIMVLVVYYAILIPIKISFDLQADVVIDGIDHIANYIFAIDLVMNFVTAIKIDGVLISRRKDICMHYLKTWFAIDFISTIPLDQMIGDSTGDDGAAHSSGGDVASINKMLRLLRIFKLFRVLRFGRLMKRLEEFTKFNPAIIRLFNLFVFLAFVWHLIGCSYWYVAVLENFAKDDSQLSRDGVNLWVPPPELWCDEISYTSMSFRSCAKLKTDTPLCFNHSFIFEDGSTSVFCPASTSTKYVFSFFWALMATTGIGRDIDPVTYVEHVFSIIMIITGVMMYAVIIGSASSALSNLDSGNAERKQKLQDVNQYMRQRRVPGDLQRRILAYYDYMWSSHQSLNEQGGIMNDLHPSLRLELHISLNRKLIENVPLFKLITDSECLIDMIEKLTPKIYIPGEYVVLQYEVGQEMYVIVRGLVHVLIGDEKKHVATLKDGDVFGEHALITRTRRNANVRAVTYCDTLVLSKADFDEVMNDYPEFFTNLQRMATGKLNKGWARVRQTLKMASAVRMFGGEVNIRDLLIGKANNTPVKSALEDVNEAVMKKREKLRSDVNKGVKTQKNNNPAAP